MAGYQLSGGIRIIPGQGVLEGFINQTVPIIPNAGPLMECIDLNYL
jgi:hypothetical protein